MCYSVYFYYNWNFMWYLPSMLMSEVKPSAYISWSVFTLLQIITITSKIPPLTENHGVHLLFENVVLAKPALSQKWEDGVNIPCRKKNHLESSQKDDLNKILDQKVKVTSSLDVSGWYLLILWFSTDTS